jgi:tetratricopeptide (TPR) repeat protein
LVSREPGTKIAGGTSNPAAYEAYLRALEHWNRNQPEDFPKAAQYYEQAIALDPNFGTAIAELAWLYWNAAGSVSREQALGLSGDDAILKSTAYFERAAKHPSPAYYQLLVERLLPQQKSDDAIAAAERAIALDPSQAWSYHQMSLALTLNGRPADGLAYVDAATRVDPVWVAWRHYLVALAYVSLGRFEDAAKSLETIGAQFKNADFWTSYVSLELLTAVYGHLGRTADAASTREKLKPYLIDMDNGEFTGLLAMRDLPFKNYEDLERVLAGLRKSGVPDLPFGFDPKSKDRLSGAEIKELLFGHEIRGHELITGDAFSLARAADGSYSATSPAWSVTGSSWIEGDTICSSNQLVLRACRAVFRNPSGTFEQLNQYLVFRHSDRFEFSVVK